MYRRAHAIPGFASIPITHRNDRRDQLDRRRLQAGGVEDLRGDDVWVAVGGGAPVLEVSLAFPLDVASDTDGRAAVGDAVRKSVDVGGLVGARQTARVALAVHLDVLLVLLAQLLDGGEDGGVAACK